MSEIGTMQRKQNEQTEFQVDAKTVILHNSKENLNEIFVVRLRVDVLTFFGNKCKIKPWTIVDPGKTILVY